MKNIARHILKHYNTLTIDKQFNAIFAVNSTKDLVKYHHIFKELLAKGYKGQNKDNFKIAAIFSPDNKSDRKHQRKFRSKTAAPEDLKKIIDDYNDTYGEAFSDENNESLNHYANNISHRVKRRKINLLLVRSMFLTGFDSPELKTLYVDQKFEKPHSLVQAISRTNRLSNMLKADQKLKQHGNIVFFQNTKETVHQALTRFSSNIKNIILEDYKHVKDRLKKDIEELKAIVPKPEMVKKLILNNEKSKNAYKAFLGMKKNLLIVKSYSEFNFTKEEIGIIKDEYKQYSAAFQELRKKQKKQNHQVEESEFSYEELKTQIDQKMTELKELKAADITQIKDLDAET